jgi:hypothetical protein
MKNIFYILPEEFFKPLNGQYKRTYADCITLIFNTFKPEISYGVNRETVIQALVNYFENETSDFIFEEDGKVVKDAREKANGMVRMLKQCGWLDYEADVNHQVNVVLMEYAIPIIESFNKVIKNEEAEYQGIISQIHASLQNKELYHKPYELIIKGINENTERLVSELKRLNASIKRYTDKQTSGMAAEEILEYFFKYHQDIGSKAYLRMKTSDNISYFRSAIIEKIDEIIANQSIMDRAVLGFMEVEQMDSKEEAYDLVLGILRDVKSAFYRLDDIVSEIDRKHSKFMKNAVLRARFLLSTGSNQEGKLLSILNAISTEMNQIPEEDIHKPALSNVEKMIHLYPQNFISIESFRAIPNIKEISTIDELEGSIITEQEKELYKEIIKERNRRRFSRKNINQYVIEVLDGKDRIKASSLPIETKRDLIRLIYINLYGNNKANNYTVERGDERIVTNGYSFSDFEIVNRDS